MKKEIKLVNDTISNQDIDKLIEWLKTYPKLTKGEKTLEFEEKWAKFIGTKYSVFVNSGSSANLMMLYALKVSKKLRNNKIVVPALGWATDLAPVMQLGFIPKLVDINFDDLSVDVENLEKVFEEEAPAALILVSVLGLPPNMTKIKTLCQKHGVYLLEDVCESLGSKHRGQNLGSFGDMSSFSLYFGHHISTIEGGMVCTDNKDLYDTLKMIRSHGWDRDLDEEKQDELRKTWNIDDFSALYTFYVPGFNLRSTDLQAFIGLLQLEKLEKIIKKRNENYFLYRNILTKGGINWLPELKKEDFVSNFCIPIIAENKQQKMKIIKRLMEEKIEVRPLIAGSLGTQPYFVKEYGLKTLPASSVVDKCGFYVPNHPGLDVYDIERICKIILGK
jgi:CDP-6-deoxy-D-xylo-4-hexulose-3-dehydrase